MSKSKSFQLPLPSSLAVCAKPLGWALALAWMPLISGPGLFAQDSAPSLVSRTGGGSTWNDLADLKKSAGMGNPKAQAALGELYVNGDQVPKDVNQGLDLLDKAVKQNNAEAAFRLGKLFDDGEAVPKDYPKAISYYQIAAKAGNPTAQYNLGVIYAGAHGVKRDFVEGLAWLILGTKNGANGDGEKQVRARLTATHQTEALAKAEARAAELAKEIKTPAASTTSASDKAAGRRGGPKASVELKTPTVVSSTPAPANAGGSNVSSSAAAGDPIKLIMPSGDVADWPSLAALERDAGLDRPDALAALGKVLVEGKLAPADPKRGIELLEKSAKAGNVDAAYQLGEAYARGTIAPKDETKAFNYSLQAAHSGIAYAMFNVGAYYANGRGTTRDYIEALAWLSLAKKRGADNGTEGKIRAYLEGSDPSKIAAADKHAAELEAQIGSAK